MKKGGEREIGWGKGPSEHVIGTRVVAMGGVKKAKKN